ncbi:hypothetical protein [Chryseobacterium sp.]|uniref:hypothetical protein n=1 Tax=Chryseobacterium sp. TaxID=1871047 RepID=UPI00289B50C1|nr:hypothetical protein [Chryseobacterium sp.]
MENCSSSMSIHQGNGTTHSERLNPALLPDFFLIDERKEEDYILFVQKLSEFVKYYDANNIEDGDWRTFFETESTSVIISIANWNINLLQNNYNTVEKEIYLSTDKNNQLNILKEYFLNFTESLIAISKKINGLDNTIAAKENLAGSLLTIVQQLHLISSEINVKSSETDFDIRKFLKNPFYTKKVQQLFGLLISWKKYAESAVEYQLNQYDSHQPHYALFLSFLKLLGFATQKLNEFTQKHLDFYYKDIIKTENQDAKPDFVHLTVEPQKTANFLLSKNTIFPAGKNSLGEKKYYSSTADQIINEIKLKKFSGFYFENQNYFKTENLITKNGAGQSFDAFLTEKTECRQEILVASPLLFLQSGERSILLRINDLNFSHNDFDFFITGEKNTIELTEKYTENKAGNSSQKIIRLQISDTEKAIIPFNTKLHSEFLVKTDFPVLKIVPKNKNLLTKVFKIELEVNVEKFTSFTLESDFGSLDAKKPFYPFSEIPKNGNGMMISSNEFFMKKNAVANFVAETDSSSNHLVWLNDKVKIYQVDKTGIEEHDDTFNETTNFFIPENFNFKEIGGAEKIRIELNNTQYSGEKYMENFVATSKKNTVEVPVSLPYKPRIKDFTFNYSAKDVVTLISGSESGTEIFSAQPFGFKKIIGEQLKFINLNSFEGHIYFGFENAVPQDSLSFLIQLEEGTANPQLPPAEILWEFLSENEWIEFENNTLADETYSLSQSGIISVTIPEFKAEKNTILDADLFWMRLSVSDIRAVCRFFGVHHQAFKAVLTDFENKGLVYSEITLKGTIGKSQKMISGVKKINQPYSSFGGKIKEENKNLYTRTSERLRHKNRAITIWDYEHILLQQFPEIFRVKTLNHYRYDTTISNVSAGYVTIIPVAKSSPTENINWKPLLSINKMQQIKEFLQKISSPHARINVKPPKSERVELDFKVKFHKTAGTDSRIYVQELMKTINQFLSPWAFDLEETNFAGNIEFSTLIKLIDNQYYVDYITDFKVTQYVLDENYNVTGSPIKNLNRVSPQTDFTLFIPTETHHILEI